MTLQSPYTGGAKTASKRVQFAMKNASIMIVYITCDNMTLYG